MAGHHCEHWSNQLTHMLLGASSVATSTVRRKRPFDLRATDVSTSCACGQIIHLIEAARSLIIRECSFLPQRLGCVATTVMANVERVLSTIGVSIKYENTTSQFHGLYCCYHTSDSSRNSQKAPEGTDDLHSDRNAVVA